MDGRSSITLCGDQSIGFILTSSPLICLGKAYRIAPQYPLSFYCQPPTVAGFHRNGRRSFSSVLLLSLSWATTLLLIVWGEWRSFYVLHLLSWSSVNLVLRQQVTPANKQTPAIPYSFHRPALWHSNSETRIAAEKLCLHFVSRSSVWHSNYLVYIQHGWGI